MTYNQTLLYIVFHHSGEVIGIYDNEEKAVDVLMAIGGDGGAIEERNLNETTPA